MNENSIQAIMIDNKTINQRIENSLNVIFADIDITAAQGRVLMYIANSGLYCFNNIIKISAINEIPTIFTISIFYLFKD